MTHERLIHNRQSIRLKSYDYTQAGYYFVTICTEDRRCLFGSVVDGEMGLNQWGQIVSEAWQWLGQQYPYVDLDQWVVMPNHLHGIIVIEDTNGRGGSRTAPTTPPSMTRRKPLGRLIGAFKTTSSKQIYKLRSTTVPRIWQRNYYEHIIRSQASLDRLRQYIANNPSQWELDELYR